MLRLLSGSANIKKSAMGGVRASRRNPQLHGNSQRDDGPSTPSANMIRTWRRNILDEMFVFENLLDLDDRAIQLLLREIQSDSLILAMKGASEHRCARKYSRTCPSAPRKMLREDLESRGPVRISEVESEQKEILKIVRRLADEGQIVLGGAARRGNDLMISRP